MAPDIRMEIMVRMFNSAYRNMYTTKTIQRMMIKAICVCESFLRDMDKTFVMHKDKKKAQISLLYLLKKPKRVNESLMKLFLCQMDYTLQRKTIVTTEQFHLC